MQPEILFEDEDLVVANKPSGFLSIPDRFDPSLPCVQQWLEQKLKQKMWVVHRIDRETSGTIVFAKNEEMHRYLSMLFEKHEVGKFYVGLLQGRVQPSEGSVEAPIAEHPTIKGKMVVTKKGKPSLTDYKVVIQWPLYALVEFRIHTGRTHQIRVHMQALGNSLVCDPLYGDGKPFFLSGIKKKFALSKNDEQERPLLGRLALHAYKIIFSKPDGSVIKVEATLPKDMAACVNQLNKWTQPEQA